MPQQIFPHLDFERSRPKKSGTWVRNDLLFLIKSCISMIFILGMGLL